MEYESERKKRIQLLDDMVNSKVVDYNLLKNKIKLLDKFILVAVKANSMIKELDDLVKEIVSHK